jgi:hypothetical protein
MTTSSQKVYSYGLIHIRPGESVPLEDITGQYLLNGNWAISFQFRLRTPAIGGQLFSSGTRREISLTQGKDQSITVRKSYSATGTILDPAAAAELSPDDVKAYFKYGDHEEYFFQINSFFATELDTWLTVTMTVNVKSDSAHVTLYSNGSVDGTPELHVWDYQGSKDLSLAMLGGGVDADFRNVMFWKDTIPSASDVQHNQSASPLPRPDKIYHCELEWKPEGAVANAVCVAGFTYDPSQDIIYSRMNALQRYFGYGYTYDKLALAASFVIDCEPIFFYYQDKVWMIELWKGQYAIETGAEIGVYVRDPHAHEWSQLLEPIDAFIGSRENDPDPDHSLFFICADDTQLLEMSFTLKRNGEDLFQRSMQQHWWLTGFKWGIYSEPEDLEMNITFKFQDDAMRKAFVQALVGLGYSPTYSNGEVNFSFTTPKTFQPRLSNPLLPAVQSSNQALVAWYNSMAFPNNDPNIMPANEDIITKIARGYKDFYAKLWIDTFKSHDTWERAVSYFTNLKLMDCSCSIEIQNNTKSLTLQLEEFGVNKSTFPPGHDLGRFDIEPPQQIAAGASGRFLLQAFHGIHGAEGWAKYSLVDGSGSKKFLYTFSFGCPTGGYRNYASLLPRRDGDYFTASVAANAPAATNVVPKYGHPLHVSFVVSANS